MAQVLTGTHKVPKIEDFYASNEEAYKNDELLRLLNSPPPEAWIKTHRGVKYLQVEKVELLLTRVFQYWTLEVISFAQIEQSVAVHVRLHYLNPATGKMQQQDGVGAMPLQTAEGAAASDLTKIKFNAVQLALPAAESYALKDAAEKIGRVFGSNLNRKDTLPFTPMFNQAEQQISGQEEVPGPAPVPAKPTNPFLTSEADGAASGLPNTNEL